MPYKLLKFEKETALIAGEQMPVYVAIVQKEGEEQPFRVSIEHFDTAEDARAQVDQWISVQDADDARWLAEQERSAKEAKDDETLDQLNSTIES